MNDPASPPKNEASHTEVTDVYEKCRVIKVGHLTYGNEIEKTEDTHDASIGSIKKDAFHAIYVFCGSDYQPPPSDLNEESYFQFIKKTGFFSKGELASISEIPSKRTQVIFINDRINLDDTIQEIKRKILKHLVKTQIENDDDYPISIPTMCLFTRIVKDLTPQRIYNELSHKGKSLITDAVLANYITNVDGMELPVDDDNVVDSKSRVYSYTDIKKLTISKEPIYLKGEMACAVFTPLGHSYSDFDKRYLFSANPFTNPPRMYGISDKTMKDESNVMLMEYGLPLYNMLYMCSYGDVISSVSDMYDNAEENGTADSETDLDIEFQSTQTMKENAIIFIKQTYFPFLKKLDIENRSATIDNFDTLKSLLTQLYEKEILPESKENIASKHINFFYNVYDSRKKTITNIEGTSSNFKYLSTGISYLHLVFKPIVIDRLFPVEAVFKTLCSSKSIPFIKMRYAGRVGDSIFKMHAPHINKYGNRVPKMSIGEFNRINRLCKSRQKNDCVSLYFSSSSTSQLHDSIYYVVIEIDSSANIDISVETIEGRTCSIANMDNVISTLVNSVLSQINILFDQSGLFIPNFGTMYDTEHVKIMKMRYNFKVGHSKKIEFKSAFKCLSSLITEVKQPRIKSDGKTKTTTTYDFKRVSNYNSAPHADKTNGLTFSFQTGNIDSNGPYSLFVISGINCIHLLTTLHVYVDAIMRIFHEEMTSVSKDLINEMCFESSGQMTAKVPSAAAPASTAAALVATAAIPTSEPDSTPPEILASPIASPNSDSERKESTDSDVSDAVSLSMSENDDSDEEIKFFGGAKAKKEPKKGENKKSQDKRKRSRSRSRSNERDGNQSTPKPKSRSKSYDDVSTPVGESQRLLDFLQTADNDLFNAKPGPGTKHYARCCTRRSKNNINKNQPVALTDSEMELYEKKSGFLTEQNKRDWPHTIENGKINWNKTSFWRYSELVNGKRVVYAIRFGSTRDSMRWYLCPRYWNNIKGLPVTDIAVEKIREKNNGVLPGYIEEFSVDGQEYSPLFPGLVEELDGRKMPCCFSQTLNTIRPTGKEISEIEKQKRTAQSSYQDLLKQYKTEVKSAKERSEPVRLERPREPDIPEYGIGIIPKWQEDILTTGIIPPLNELNAKIQEESLKKSQLSSKPDLNAASTSTNVQVIGERIKSSISKLTANQLGYLPIPIQKFFNVNDKCDLSTGCLLRHGVEHSVTQSFLGAVACIYNSKMVTSSGALTIAQMRKLISDSVSLDSFVSYNNGTLVSQFTSDIVDSDVDKMTTGDEIKSWLSIHIAPEIKNSAIYTKLSTNDAAAPESEDLEKKLLLYHICKALARFKELVLNDSVTLDHTLLWEVITSPNPAIFKQGINIIVLDIPNNDDTHTVNILCPPNRYAEQLFNHRQSFAFMIRQEAGGASFYEPICLYGQQKGASKTLQFLFNVHTNMQTVAHPNMFENVKQVIYYVKNIQNVYCPPVISRMNFISTAANSLYNGSDDLGHKFRPNLHAKKIERILLQSGFKIYAQVLNYDNRVIGLIVQYGEPDSNIGYIPTESSEIIINDEINQDQSKQYGVGYGPKYDLKYTDDSTIPWMSYQMTLSFLKMVKSKTDLPCKPVTIVLDDSDKNMAIGILTETNQFVRLSGPEPLPSLPTGELMMDTPTAFASAIGVKDHHTIDKAILLDRGYNSSLRSKFIQMVELESNFYNAFRITARHLINSLSSHSMDGDVSLSKKLYDIVFQTNTHMTSDATVPNPGDSTPTNHYTNRLKKVKKLLYKLMHAHVEFVDYDVSALNKIETCISGDACDKGLVYCARDDELTSTDKPCKLRIPFHRIMFKNDNGNPSDRLMEPLFYSRLADELIRYPKMRDFLFIERPNDYYIATRIPHVTCEDEIVLTQAMIIGTESHDGYFTNEANQPDGQENTGANPRANKIKVNTSVFNIKRKKITKMHERSAVPKTVISCLENKNGPYIVDVFQGAFPDEIADPRVVKNGDITFALLINVLHVHGKLEPEENVMAVKQKLVECYNDLIQTKRTINVSKVCNIWTKCGIQMKRLATEVSNGSVTLENAIKSSVYTLTPLDIWLLCVTYEIPSVMFYGPDSGHVNELSRRFFCNGCTSSPNRARVLYLDGHSVVDSCYVFVSMYSFTGFPVYGIVQYTNRMNPDTKQAKPAFSIHVNDIRFSEPVGEIYGKNEKIIDFIETVTNTNTTTTGLDKSDVQNPKPTVGLVEKALRERTG